MGRRGRSAALPANVPNGRLVHVQPSDTSPTGRLVLALDQSMDRLMPGGDLYVDPAGLVDRAREQGRAGGLAEALAVITCYDVDEIRQQAKIRWQRRQEEK